jgi:hypothetical protein
MNAPGNIFSVYNRRYCPPNLLFPPHPATSQYNRKINPWSYDWAKHIESAHSNIPLLTPAIFGGAAAFALGFFFYGRCRNTGYKKVIFFVDIFSLIATFGVGAFIYRSFKLKEHDGRYYQIVWPVAFIIFFYASVYNVIYSLYPHTLSGTIGKTPMTQFLSFLALSIGSITVGESFGINFEDAGVQILGGTEALFNLYVLSLIVSLVV